jgi:hypothetical protein
MMTYKGITKLVPAELVAQAQSGGAVVVDAPVAAPSVSMTYKGITKDIPADQVEAALAGGATRNVAGGRARAFASTADAMLGGIVENTATVGARFGDAWEKGDGAADTANRLASEAVRGWSPLGALASVATAGPLGAPAREAGAQLLRHVGVMGSDELAPAEAEMRAENQAQLDADSAADPVGTGVAKAAAIAAGIAALQPTAAAGAARAATSAGVTRGLDAAKAAMGGAAAQTVRQTARGMVEEIPVLGRLAKAGKLYRALSDDAATVLLRTTALKHGTVDAATLAAKSGLSPAQVERGLANLAKTSSFADDLAMARQRLLFP